jgi:hypothetical protein
MEETLKKYSTIGCCGIDCGLCPRFHTKGGSVCPGCGGINFKEKHPSCGFVTCCVIKNGKEVCSDCSEYICKRFEPEKRGFDSFVSHKRVFRNLDFIRDQGMDSFIDQQKIRMQILSDFLNNYDDGRSKSFFCISCALLPLEKLQETHGFMSILNDSQDIKEKNKRLKDRLFDIAWDLNIELKLNNKK